jgi:steroid delta-isomerase-like uncharacterized protein
MESPNEQTDGKPSHVVTPWGKEPRTMSRSTETLRQRREAIVREHIDAENAHDAARTIATFHRPRYEVAPFGTPNDGAESVHQLLSGMFAAFPDLHVAVSRFLHADEAVVVECVMTATHRGPFAGLEPTDRRIELPLAAIFEFEDDRLMCEKLYFDMATLMRQLQG